MIAMKTRARSAPAQAPDPYPAIVCAIMALGLALGPQLPRALGYPEAIWGRGMSLLAASIPLVMLMAPRGAREQEARSWGVFHVTVILAGIFVGIGFGVQWDTPSIPFPHEIAWAKNVYVSIYISLQMLLALAWLIEAERQVLRIRDGGTPYVPLLGAFLAAVGAGMALIVQVLLSDPNLTGPWQIPIAAQKDVQIGDIGIAMLRIGMLGAALAPLAWWLGQRARGAMRET